LAFETTTATVAGADGGGGSGGEEVGGAQKDATTAEKVADEEGGAGVREEAFLRMYTETGRNAAFDRTLSGFLTFLRDSLDLV